MKRYENNKITKRFDGKRVYLTTTYPKVTPDDSDVIIITNENSYLDKLAYQYYGDPTLWVIIALANNLGKGRLSVPLGTSLRIPTNINKFKDQIVKLNE